MLTVIGATVIVSLVSAGSRPGGDWGDRPVAGSATSSPARAHTDLARRRATSTPVATGRHAHVSVPILMYHVIKPAPPGARFPGLYVAPAEFAAQMRALERAGWVGVTLDQVSDS